MKGEFKVAVEQTSDGIKPVCVGLDVHKNNVYACVCVPHYEMKDGKLLRGKNKSKTQKFPSNYTDLCAMCNWIEETARKYGVDVDELPDPIDVYMESTGKYSTPVFNVCEEKGLNPHIVNPKNVKMIAGQKTDVKDARWIATLGLQNNLRPSYIPCREIRDARRISRTRTKLVHSRGDEMRRIQNVLTEANIRVDLIFSGIEGESARKVITYLLETENPVLEELQKQIRKSCRIMKFKDKKERKEKEEELRKAFLGAKFSSSQKFELRAAYKRIDRYDEEIRNYEDMMKDILSPFKTELELLESIPGVSRLSAMQILCEIGNDMDAFETEKNFISWCGLCPQSNQSNNKHKSVKIGKGGYYLKPVLIQCALAAVKNPYYGNKYKTIYTRRGKKRALIAIARKMMIAAYHMLKTGEFFCPNDLEIEEVEEEKIEQEQSEEMKTENVEEIEKAVQELVESTRRAEPELVEKVENLIKQIMEQIPICSTLLNPC